MHYTETGELGGGGKRGDVGCSEIICCINRSICNIHSFPGSFASPSV